MANSALFELLTGRQLVKALAHLGLGERTPDAVRQWIRENPPCPIAAPGEMGMGHRYRLLEVLAWLEQRAAAADDGKGFTRADGKRTLQLIQEAIAQAQALLRAETLPAPGEGVAEPSATSQVAAHGDGAAVEPAASPAPLAQDFSQAKNPSPDMLGSGRRDPRTALAEEQARLTRIKADIAAGKLVPVADLDRSLQAQAEAFRAAAEEARVQIKHKLPDLPRDDARSAMVDGVFDEMLERLAVAEDLPPDAPATGLEA